MHIQLRSKADTTESLTNAAVQKKHRGGIAFEDNRPQAVAQRKLKQLINNNHPAGDRNAPVQRVFKDDNGTQMDATQIAAVTSANALLTPAMLVEIDRRAGHLTPYILSKTIRSLTSGSVQPHVPSASASGWSSRTSAGYVNPSHPALSVRPLFRDAAPSPLPLGTEPDTAEEWDFLSDPARRFLTYSPTHTSPPVTVYGHQETVMGHGPVDAVDDWNTIGHTRPRHENMAHNRDPGIYHGLEERHASARSGGNTTSRYVTPSAAIGSHPSYYDPNDPGYDPRSSFH